MNKVTILFLLTCILFSDNAFSQEGLWSAEKANRWYNQYTWLAGTNFAPSTAINQLEFWQEETFDAETIDRELKWSAELGFNVHRVYLHNLVWEYDSGSFLERIEAFLDMADRYGIKIMFVLLDDVWDPNPQLGKQREPIQGLHNSGWVQSPGRAYLEDESKHHLIKGYVQGILRHFKNDNRVLLWDLYNEPDNHNVNSYGNTSEVKTELSPADKEKYSYRLLKKVFQWAREVNPSQPLSVGIWKGKVENWGNPDQLPRVDRLMIENSDVITFHAYDNSVSAVQAKIDQLKKYNRPIICTEYMARTNNNTFREMMPLFKENQNWSHQLGFCCGQEQYHLSLAILAKGF